MGAENFDKCHDFDYLRDPKVPPYFIFIYSTFIELYNMSGDSITWTQIESYGILRKIDFTQKELELLIACNNWANSKIAEMREQE